VIEELLSTEIHYLQGLVDIHKDFMLPLQQQQQQHHDQQHQIEYHALFSSLDMIMHLHSQLLSSLHQRIAHDNFTVFLGVGDVLANVFNSQQLGIYTPFVGRYQLLLKTHEKMKAKPSFQAIQMVKKFFDIHSSIFL
jgi:hypothetical protein